MFATVQPAISPQAIESFFALAIGFAVAGSCANGYRLFGERNSVRARRIERRRGQMVMAATVIAGLWSLMSATVVVMAFEAFIRA
jgi:hypothetical protein